MKSIIYDNVMQLLVDKKIIPDNIQLEIEKMYSFMKNYYAEQELNIELLTREILLDYGIFEGSAKVLEDNTDHIEWLANERANIKWKFWGRYRKYLEVQEKLPPEVIKNIDNTTDEILKRLESPKREGNWDRRGMVVGDVQSGKTSNYSGLITKALDAQYKIVIILAGLNNDLRSQTQKRIDKGVIGRDTRKKESYDQTSSKIGAGLLPGFEEPPIISVTSADASGDFKKKVHETITITPGGDPIVAVVKKNVTPLKNLLNWFTSANNQGKIANVPLLLIDDEADNASIDTKSLKRIGVDDDDVDLEEQDPTKINGLIRQILNCFTQSAYVGYTATPFANIFIYPTNPNNVGEEYGEDLYPRSFIVNLHAPSNYIGPEKVFGLYQDRTANLKEVKPLPLVRCADDYLDCFPEKHKKDLIVTGLPDSLYRAIYSFILSSAARELRGQENKHHSMLVHVTRFVDVQAQITELLSEAVKKIASALEFRTGPFYDSLIIEMKAIWENDYLPTSIIVKDNIEDPLIEISDWEDIEKRLYQCASRIEVKSVNGKAADGGLDYDSYPNGCRVIAVGGDKLSRGLTLEGLSVSYYARISRMYDTLLQMGRWFGYRNGYADLCRLYTSNQLVEWYRHIAVANAELKHELDDMADLGATPETYGLKVRTHPDGMIITALNKMRNSEKRTVTYAGKLVQITRYYKDNNCNENNFNYLCRWIETLGDFKEPCPDTRNNYCWYDVSAERIVDFISNISIHHSCSNASPKIVSEYIMNQVEDGELTEWTVGLVSVASSLEKRTVGGCEIGLAWRSDSSVTNNANPDTVYIINNNLITESDQEIVLNSQEYEMAMKRTIDNWKANEKNNNQPKNPSPVWIRKCQDKKKGLLLIYVFQSGVKDKETYKNIYVGYAIGFPYSDTARSIEYKVDEVYLRNNLDE